MLNIKESPARIVYQISKIQDKKESQREGSFRNKVAMWNRTNNDSLQEAHSEHRGRKNGAVTESWVAEWLNEKGPDPKRSEAKKVLAAGGYHDQLSLHMPHHG